MFVMLKAPGDTGKRMLLNLDLCVSFSEGDKGEAIALTIGGFPVVTGETFNSVLADMMAPPA